MASVASAADGLAVVDRLAVVDQPTRQMPVPHAAMPNPRNRNRFQRLSTGQKVLAVISAPVVPGVITTAVSPSPAKEPEIEKVLASIDADEFLADQ